MMKKLVSMVLAVLMTVSLAACAGNSGANTAANTSTTQPEASQSVSGSAEASTHEASAQETSTEGSRQESASGESAADTPTGRSEAADSAAAVPQESVAEDSGETPSAEEPGSKALVVVFSATGVTKGVAEKIAAITGADLYEIKAATEYTSEDLNWNDRGSRSTLEQNDKSVRPAIGSDTISLAGYETIYIGFPIWWGEEPRILDTFVESYTFDGITMIPFCTSSSSGIGRSGRNLAENAGTGNWLEGKRFSGSVSEEELRGWIESLQS